MRHKISILFILCVLVAGLMATPAGAAGYTYDAATGVAKATSGEAVINMPAGGTMNVDLQKGVVEYNKVPFGDKAANLGSSGVGWSYTYHGSVSGTSWNSSTKLPAQSSSQCSGCGATTYTTYSWVGDSSGNSGRYFRVEDEQQHNRSSHRYTYYYRVSTSANGYDDTTVNIGNAFYPEGPGVGRLCFNRRTPYYTSPAAFSATYNVISGTTRYSWRSMGLTDGRGVSWDSRRDCYDRYYYFRNNSLEANITDWQWDYDADNAYTEERTEKYTLWKTYSTTPTVKKIPKWNPIQGASVINTVELKNCTTSNLKLTTSTNPLMGAPEVIIDGGTYTGAPAVSGSNITVKRGTFTDTSGTSQFLIDPDSEATVSTSGNKTVTVVKLTNPPIIIDWEDFPGLDLNVDLAAPTIEVIRTPADSRTPTDKVTLTIHTEDPNGNDHELPISINGGAFQASPATFTATENQIVSIVARDNQGNVREYQVNITNIDANAPEVTGFTQSTEVWTKDPVRVYCNATDDVKLDLTPYKFEFQPFSGGSTVTTDWQADRSFQVTENGTLYCYVRDSLGKETKSDPYYIRNIDKIAPTATYELSPPDGTKASPNEGVVIELTLVNTGDPVTEDGSALATTAVKWSDTEAWSSDTRMTVYENGTYNIRVRDAVGNVSGYIPITVNNISTDKPVIDSLTGTHLSADFVQAPATLTVTAHGGGTTPLASKPYSWDGGKTWTSLDDYKVYENGEYTVTVRDETGTTVEASIIVSNIDAVKPTASVYLFKGLPADGSGSGPDDYVWKIRVEAEDIGSGVDHVETLWDGGTHTSFPIIQDIEEAGVYGVIVYDKAGNQTYAEKVVTNESIGGDTGSNNNAYVDIQVPSTGTAGGHFNASIGDLVYGPTGAYNKVTGSFITYESGVEGIQANIVATAKRGTWLTGYATFNSVRYPVTFGGAEGIDGGSNIAAQVFIPISSQTTDTRNGRLIIVLQEWEDDTMATLKREGSATLYTSVQVNEPKINYSYNRGTDELSLVATSAVAGIKSITYDTGSGPQAYAAPFTVGGASTVTLIATDNVNNVTTLVLDGDSLPVSGSGGGSLPTEDITGGGVTSYYIAGRSAETYIIGGTRSNTESVPSSSVFDAILGG